LPAAVGRLSARAPCEASAAQVSESSNQADERSE